MEIFEQRDRARSPANKAANLATEQLVAEWKLGVCSLVGLGESGNGLSKLTGEASLHS